MTPEHILVRLLDVQDLLESLNINEDMPL